MKRILFVISVTLMLLFLSGCGGEGFPRIKIMDTPWSSVIYVDIANRSTFDRYERFDDENETKIVLYFNKRKEG